MSLEWATSLCPTRSSGALVAAAVEALAIEGIGPGINGMVTAGLLSTEPCQLLSTDDNAERRLRKPDSIAGKQRDQVKWDLNNKSTMLNVLSRIEMPSHSKVE